MKAAFFLTAYLSRRDRTPIPMLVVCYASLPPLRPSFSLPPSWWCATFSCLPPQICFAPRLVQPCARLVALSAAVTNPAGLPWPHNRKLTTTDSYGACARIFLRTLLGPPSATFRVGRRIAPAPRGLFDTVAFGHCNIARYYGPLLISEAIEIIDL